MNENQVNIEIMKHSELRYGNLLALTGEELTNYSNSSKSSGTSDTAVNENGN